MNFKDFSFEKNSHSLQTLKLREVVRACLNLNPDERPDISQITKVANQMHQHFQSIGNLAPVTPSPQEMQQS